MTRTSRGSRISRILSARPRLWASVAFGVLVFGLLTALPSTQVTSRALLAWNAGALLYLGLAAEMVLRARPEGMRRRALEHTEGRLLALFLVVVSSVAVLVAVGSQLAAVREMQGSAKTLHVALAALTVLSSWLFTQTLFALHYAHDYYRARAAGRPDALLFPGTPQPVYGDFFYFACVIGTSGQTADVAFNGSELRPVGVLHCILAFFFNTTVLALAINIGAGLF
jgi:uncharacterized membrane protein